MMLTLHIVLYLCNTFIDSLFTTFALLHSLDLARTHWEAGSSECHDLALFNDFTSHCQQ